MSMSKEIRELVNALGGLAEFCRILVNSLEANGFSRTEAVDMAKDYLIVTLTQKPNKQEEN